jgi:hypothetical protein
MELCSKERTLMQPAATLPFKGDLMHVAIYRKRLRLTLGPAVDQVLAHSAHLADTLEVFDDLSYQFERLTTEKPSIVE